jgi:hypothetical protein
MNVRLREPRFTVSCQFEAEGIQTTSFIYEGEKPRELMDQYQQIAGDGKASISVSTDMAVKKFGNGASAMVTISLTCGQDQQSLQTALGLAASMGRWYAKQFQAEAEAELRNQLVAQGRSTEF